MSLNTRAVPDGPNGLLLVDKPVGITSFDIIRCLRRQTGIHKIGHAGTLDPMASGLMLMLVGRATKQAGHFSKLDKTYEAEVTLGATSVTGDREGELTPGSGRRPTWDELEATLQEFTGIITQQPSQYSAIKVGGVRAYKLARQGKAVDMPSRRVTVYALRLLGYDYPVVRFEVEVSSGTYIRTLAQDIGTALGTGAYLSVLRRTQVGQFRLAQANTLDTISSDNLVDCLIIV